MKILVVEDELVTREALQFDLTSLGHQVVTASNCEEGLARFVATGDFEVVITDWLMDEGGMQGLAFVKAVRAHLRQNPQSDRVFLLVLTAYRHQPADIAAGLDAGADDFLPKPASRDLLRVRLEVARRMIGTARYADYLREEIRSESHFAKFDQIIGKSPALRNLYEMVTTVAATDATVLILGETGTGKRLVAEKIHELSQRRGRPLVAVNCAVLKPELLGSELFGHVKGAYTGADRNRVGRFELANGGTIFLDEIGDLPVTSQAEVLKVLEEKTFEPVGSSESRQVDVRILAATNKNLKEAVQEKSFREDLYYRLNVVTLTVPPLRERREDIPLLAHYFLKDFGRKYKKDVTLPEDTLRRLTECSFPGNVRQLEKTLEAAVILARGREIAITDWSSLNGPGQESPDADLGSLTDRVQEFEKALIAAALEQCAGKIEGADGAAQRLGLAAGTLRDKVKRYGLGKSTAGHKPA